MGGEEVAAFVRHALPPADPAVVFDAALVARLRAAEQALVRLELAGEMIPSLDWFLRTELFALVAADRARVLAQEGMCVVALRLFELLPRHPVLTVASVMKFVETSKPTAGRAIELLLAANVLAETTGKKRDRSFV